MKSLVSVIWWPHSGGRWLNRSILAQHSNVHLTAFTHPFLYYSTDMIMELDNTAQVHKARSMPELKGHLEALVASISHGKQEALTKYFELISRYDIPSHESLIVGEVCMGSPIPRTIDVELMQKAHPEMKVIHLVRNPIDSFTSFANRYEMDSDPVKIAGSWLTLNCKVRDYYQRNDHLTANYHCIRYEDLMNDAESTVKELCLFLDIEFDKGLLGNLKQRWGRNTANDIDDVAKRTFVEVAESELKKYNYL